MNFTRKQIFIVAGAAAVVIVLLVLVAWNWRSTASTAPVSLKFWGIEDRKFMDPILQAYKAVRPNVTISYQQIDQAKYESAVLDALASGQGPDVLAIGNRDLPREMNKLAPVAQTQMGITTFESLFPTAAEQDFVSASGSQIYALPLYLDTLAMFYNKDMFDSAAITAPPKTWDDFIKLVPLLRKITNAGQITQAAAAIGGSEISVPRAVDLLSLLMLQNGTKMTSTDFPAASFASVGSDNKNHGLAAFNFYLQFANGSSPYYTWNDGLLNALDAFAGGKAAIIFDYAAAIADIKSKSPFLNFGIAQVPQVTGASLEVNEPKYAGLAVSKQSKESAWAWDFIIFAATNNSASRAYLAASGHPPALRSLIAEKVSDPAQGQFARAALTARSWYQADAPAIDNILNTAIGNVLSGKTDSLAALRGAEEQVSQLMRANTGQW